MNLPPLFTFISLFLPVLCLAHGDSKPGPHGGEIQMPGAFHVELVATTSAVHVYLLDLHFENPQVANSSVEVTLDRNGDQFVLECTPLDSKKIFSCPLPGGMKPDEGVLMVTASRAGMPAAPMRFPLPLKWSDTVLVSE